MYICWLHKVNKVFHHIWFTKKAFTFCTIYIYDKFTYAVYIVFVYDNVHFLFQYIHTKRSMLYFSFKLVYKYMQSQYIHRILTSIFSYCIEVSFSTLRYLIFHMLTNEYILYIQLQYIPTQTKSF